eukprot:TRINITY_DN343_c0_g1_i1.p5 TRINITY_DN343_c0_g1~~TRINITY_DN343_c0_g1_i1.p5  ORF type:complete len:56 (+),score=29.53 TRINITY_DN343_c0_g1_i1:521-688(+)
MLVWWIGIVGLAAVSALFFHLTVEVPFNYLCNLAPWRKSTDCVAARLRLPRHTGE